MGKFYLHGGKTLLEVESNHLFREKLIVDSNKLPILMCYFSTLESDWEKYFEKHSIRFKQIDPEVKLELATPDNFLDQLNKAKVLYLSGGDSFLLISALQRYNNLREHLEGKIVAGISAGACALSKHFYSNDEQRLADGLGILNIKVYCHYRNELMMNIDKLKNYSTDLPIVALPEAESAIIFN